MVETNIFSTIIAVFFPLKYKNMFQSTCTEQKVTDSSKLHRQHQKCGLDMLQVTILTPRIWEWHLHVWKICEAWPNKCWCDMEDWDLRLKNLSFVCWQRLKLYCAGNWLLRIKELYVTNEINCTTNPKILMVIAISLLKT